MQTAAWQLAPACVSLSLLHTQQQLRALLLFAECRNVLQLPFIVVPSFMHQACNHAAAGGGAISASLDFVMTGA